MNHLIKISKSDGTLQLFEEEKLISSLKRAGANEEAIDEVVDEVEKEMTEGMPTAAIYSRAFELLKKHSRPVAARYSTRRAMFELGPDGFPFEKFVAKIFKLWGYEAVTDQKLVGTCVEHEVDVVAWKKDELKTVIMPGVKGDLAMAEVKFHNEFGLKSDLKVSLYVKARFDDLAEGTFVYGGVKRRLTKEDRYLFTNTKFTEAAIKYGECKGLKLISWNYPHDKCLHKIIQESSLYPITCLTTIDNRQKRGLINLGIIICSDLVANPGALKVAGVDPDTADLALNEANIIPKMRE
jgi:hypothetical protein